MSKLEAVVLGPSSEREIESRQHRKREPREGESKESQEPREQRAESRDSRVREIRERERERERVERAEVYVASPLARALIEKTSPVFQSLTGTKELTDTGYR